jgi:hypothetical protein
VEAGSERIASNTSCQSMARAWFTSSHAIRPKKPHSAMRRIQGHQGRCAMLMVLIMEKPPCGLQP